MQCKSAKELSRLLMDYQINFTSGGVFDPFRIGEHLVVAAQSDENAPPLAKLLSAMDSSGNGIMGVLAYWKLRDQVRDFQVKNNISSVLWDEEDWNGTIFRFPTTESQLQFMPQDLAILRRHKQRVLQQWASFTHESKLDWFIEEEHHDHFLTVPEVIELAERFDYVTLSHWDTHPVKCGDTMQVLYWVKSYSLWLCMAPNDDGTEELIHIQSQIKFTNGDRQLFLGE